MKLKHRFQEYLTLKKYNMLQFIKAILIMSLLVSTNLPAQVKKDVKLFILSGQSNATGAGNGDLLSKQELELNSEVLQYRGNSWEKMAPYSRKTAKFNIDNSAFGAEFYFSKELKQRYPNSIIAIVKVALSGGTSIVAWDKDNKRKDWLLDLKEVDNEAKAKLKLYDNLIAEVSKSVKLLKKRSDVGNIELSGMLWLQTERDGKSMETIVKYEDRLTAFINNIRNDLKTPKLPFFVMDAHIKKRGTLKQQQAMLRRVGRSLHNVRIIPCEDLPTHEGVHFNSEGQTILGKRFAQYYVNYTVAEKPPLGWNSFDSYGVYLHEKAAYKNLEAFDKLLKPFGYEYFVIDAGWFGEFKLKSGTIYPSEKHALNLSFDENGLLQPSKTYFPNGIKPIADRCHELGIKFGIHLMRGIPRAAVKQNLRIKNSKYTASQVADTTSICSWNHQNYGINMDHPGGQEFYNSLVNQMADWGVDFLKYDDIVPFPKEVAGVVKAIEQSGRPIVLSLSPGGKIKESALPFFKQANMLRVTHDIWDEEKGLNQCFDAWKKWQGKEEPGFWVDMDMIPFGQLQLMSPKPKSLSGKESQNELKDKINSGELTNVELLAGKGWTRWSEFTTDQKYTFITLRALSASPLMMGGNLPNLDKLSHELITNPDVLECNQNGVMGALVLEKDGIEVWKTEEKESENGWIGIFNRNHKTRKLSVGLETLGLDVSQKYDLRMLWKKKKFKEGKQKITAQGVLFIRYKKK